MQINLANLFKDLLFNIDEVLYGVAEKDNDILYTLDQLTTASIEISAESTDITDKLGNVVRTIYTSKTGTFSASNAFLHPQIMNAASGSDIQEASSTAKIVMPKIEVYALGTTEQTIKKTDVKDWTTVEVIALYGSGASKQLTDDEKTAAIDSAGKNFVVPVAVANGPVEYMFKYDRDVESGIKLVNDATTFPDLVQLTLLCSYVDPCDDDLKPCYVVIPRFMADPSATISMDRETQEMDFNGNLNIDYCASTKALYYIYFPDEVTTK